MLLPRYHPASPPLRDGALHGPVTWADPAAHFLAAAPGRTPRSEPRTGLQPVADPLWRADAPRYFPFFAFAFTNNIYITEFSLLQERFCAFAGLTSGMGAGVY